MSSSTNHSIRMKNHQNSSLTTLFAILCSACLAHGGTVGNVTLRLVEQWEAPALRPKDQSGQFIGSWLVFENEYSTTGPQQRVDTYEYGSRAVTTRISNREFLELLVFEGVISDIRGWALVVLQSTSAFSDEEEDFAPQFFIEKRGEQPVNVSQYLRMISHESGATADAGRYSRVETTNAAANTSVVREQGTVRSSSLVNLLFESDGIAFNLYGVLDYSERLRTTGRGDTQQTVGVPGARRVNEISGWSAESHVSSESDEDASLVSGSINMAAGRPVDPAAYAR